MQPSSAMRLPGQALDLAERGKKCRALEKKTC
jgi:hypothetical protein